MKNKKRKQTVLFLAFVLFVFITILFFNGEKLLGEGWSYIPSTAIRIAFVICFIWQILLIVFCYRLQKKLKVSLTGWIKKAMIFVIVVMTTGIVLGIGKNFIMYSLDFDEKVEQYDQHIALYVDNTFARTRFRYPHYQYEENVLLKRNLNKKELKDVIQRYGDPDDYYQEYN